MESLFRNKDNLFDLKKKVKNKDSSLFKHYIIKNIPISKNTISIVMTSSNRSKQVYYTLDTIKNSNYKNIQVIIVDDSDNDPILEINLQKYPFYIDLICIKKENRSWHNPCVNYNIGFEFIKGNKIVIQNGEVCHVGDFLSYVNNNIIDNNYYVCDVKAVNSLNENDVIYNKKKLTTDIYKQNIFLMWYQGRERVCNYHFLSALTKNTFDSVKFFSYDFSYGNGGDDDDLLLKIISKKINIINLFQDLYHFGGIHLYHNKVYHPENGFENADILLKNKLEYYNKNKIYVDISENIDCFNIYYNALSNQNNITIYINNNTKLEKLQKSFLLLRNIKLLLIFDKKNYTSNMNSFRKCILKKYLYKNSNIKLPKSLDFRVIFE